MYGMKHSSTVPPKLQNRILPLIFAVTLRRGPLLLALFGGLSGAVARKRSLRRSQQIAPLSVKDPAFRAVSVIDLYNHYITNNLLVEMISLVIMVLMTQVH